MVIVTSWWAAASAARQLAVRSLNLIANLLGALREGDYSIRGAQRAGAAARWRWSCARSTISAIDLAAPAHGGGRINGAAHARHGGDRRRGVRVRSREQLLLVNKAAERALRQDERGDDWIGRAPRWASTSTSAGEPRRLVDRAFGGKRGRYEVRRALFYREGRQHQLVVLADLSQALREQEQAAWQRIVRVLGHEINNSLTPIKSIAHSLRRIVDRARRVQRTAEVQQGLSLIERTRRARSADSCGVRATGAAATADSRGRWTCAGLVCAASSISRSACR